MTDFSLYFPIGWEHIVSWDGSDHILFILLLAIAYPAVQSKKLLLLITAFTVGHSISLALAVMQVVRVSSAWVEFLIPVTIFLTGLLNLFKNRGTTFSDFTHYGIVVFFGLIHGLGFSAVLSAMVIGQQITLPLLWFNVGLEVGQLVVVFGFLALTWAVENFLLPEKIWRITISLLVMAFSLYLIQDRARAIQTTNGKWIMENVRAEV